MLRIFTVLGLMLGAAAAQADQIIGSYHAYIGEDDLYNSKGARLSAPWQVLRQDRANFHKFGIFQPGDEWDPFFDDIGDRGRMEQWIMNGWIDPAAADILMRGGASVLVEIYGRGSTGTSIRVTVAR
ncbi:hypothetical protein VK792_15515 [Mesobacterium sp. TK19101]|uniref:Uncharacterized protein n=1 Tax=Mesobacterium hydrothermale TaxID=3111907 RepID=A0ABU6HJS6_9RHOB|nr:hypothetical protein [Mesobacterium sp. TK19101]MEC3862699.1 hypothetical protein [Mesobacterium sp. TK19101]